MIQQGQSKQKRHKKQIEMLFSSIMIKVSTSLTNMGMITMRIKRTPKPM